MRLLRLLAPLFASVLACGGQSTPETSGAAASTTDTHPSDPSTPVEEPLPDEQSPPVGQTQCGGMRGLACDEGEFCMYEPRAQCGAADQLGRCQPRPEACVQVYQPVCGCDGKTYGNGCAAHMAGVSVASQGECEAP